LIFYECETWYVTLREEHRLRVFENRVLRRIFEPKWDEIIGDWRKLCNVEIRNSYSRTDIIRMIRSRMRWAEVVARIGENISAFRDLAGKRGKKRPLDIPRDMCEDNIKMDFREIEWSEDWIRLV
jgi:hypothetical protein